MTHKGTTRGQDILVTLPQSTNPGDPVFSLFPARTPPGVHPSPITPVI
jgi:hypothetical protein